MGEWVLSLAALGKIIIAGRRIIQLFYRVFVTVDCRYQHKNVNNEIVFGKRFVFDGSCDRQTNRP